LNGNLCFSGNFDNPSKIAVLQQTLNEKCCFKEAKPTAIGKVIDDIAELIEISRAQSTPVFFRLENEF
jgi:hypothetical protein